MQSAEVFHPAIFIQEELDERGWTLRDLVFRMRRYESEKDWAVNMLAFELYMAVREKGVLLGEEMAHDLSVAFGTSVEFWVNLDAAWRGRAPQPRGIRF